MERIVVCLNAIIIVDHRSNHAEYQKNYYSSADIHGTAGSNPYQSWWTCCPSHRSSDNPRGQNDFQAVITSRKTYEVHHHLVPWQIYVLLRCASFGRWVVWQNYWDSGIFHNQVYKPANLQGRVRWSSPLRRSAEGMVCGLNNNLWLWIGPRAEKGRMNLIWCQCTYTWVNAFVIMKVCDTAKAQVTLQEFKYLSAP